jgi:hypothetical protein
MRKITCLGLALVALGAAGVAQADRRVQPAEPAGEYMSTIVREKLASEYAVAWRSLYPAHQRVASLDAYVGCEGLMPPAGALVGIRVLRVFDERIAVAGVARKVMSRAVRVRVLVASPAFPLFPVAIVQTFHAIAVDRQWKWILSRDQYAYYRAATCPYA